MLQVIHSLFLVLFVATYRNVLLFYLNSLQWYIAENCPDCSLSEYIVVQFIKNTKRRAILISVAPPPFYPFSYATKVNSHKHTFCNF